ncbi:uncharacterized protein Dvar_17240 [Desulfosarcina variabilis str. Montpellier]|uniref:hypothetical protein n=1 Tax=Desulfosarcina variabilis TaxID=2300 RepID=UPI003AFB378C
MFKGSLNIISGIVAVLFLGIAGLGGLMGLSQPAIFGILLVGAILTLSPRMVLEWEKGALVVVPSSMQDSLGGQVLGMAAQGSGTPAGSSGREPKP